MYLIIAFVFFFAGVIVGGVLIAVLSIERVNAEEAQRTAVLDGVFYNPDTRCFRKADGSMPSRDELSDLFEAVSEVGERKI